MIARPKIVETPENQKDRKNQQEIVETFIDIYQQDFVDKTVKTICIHSKLIPAYEKLQELKKNRMIDNDGKYTGQVTKLFSGNIGTTRIAILQELNDKLTEAYAIQLKKARTFVFFKHLLSGKNKESDFFRYFLQDIMQHHIIPYLMNDLSCIKEIQPKIDDYFRNYTTWLAETHDGKNIKKLLRVEKIDDARKTSQVSR